MKLSFQIIALLCLFIGSAKAQVTKLPTEVKKGILDTHDPSLMKLVNKVSDIPVSILQVCKKEYSDFMLANPQEQYQATCTVTNPNLPRRRLCWAVSIPGYFILHYELGGISHSTHVFIFSYTPSKPNEATLVWKGVSIPFPSYCEFYEALAGKSLDDTLDYRH